MKYFTKSLHFFQSFLLIVLIISQPTLSHSSSEIKITGSSTIYPFIKSIATEFEKNSKFKAPHIESNGTGGGFTLFCTDSNSTDIINASRQINQREKELCNVNGITDVTEIKIGYDGIIIASAINSPSVNFTKEHLFKAISKKVPIDGKLVDNPYRYWNEIDSNLPNFKIKVFGPPVTSGTRDSFVDIILHPVCLNMKEFKKSYFSRSHRKIACSMIRNDGVYIESGENDDIIVQKLKENQNTYGIFGFSHLHKNKSSIKASKIEGIEPTIENITNKKYPISRPLYLYIKNSNINKTAGLNEFINKIVSTNSIGESGYLIKMGLAPIMKEELEEVQLKISSMTRVKYGM